MSIIFDPLKKVKLKDNIEHQGIGGHIIILERKLHVEDAPANIALMNFLERRVKENKTIPDIVYYGHVNHLGYFVSEDEFDGELEDIIENDFKEIW